jgi:hypothetical protein
MNTSHQPSNSIVRRGRLFPEGTISQKEQRKRQAEIERFHQRGRVIFDRIYPELIDEHYNWFVLIEPDSGDYFINSDEILALQEAREKYPDARFTIFRLNETGSCGKI